MEDVSIPALMFFGIPLEPSCIEQNVPEEVLRIRALAQGAVKTKRGSIALFPKVKRRDPACVFTFFGSEEELIWRSDRRRKSDEVFNRVMDHVKKAFALMKDQPFVKVDRLLGQILPYTCRLYISKNYPGPALLWGKSLSEVSAFSVPDITVVSIPEYPEQLVLEFPDMRLQILLGIDYGGEHKMGFLKLWNYDVKRRQIGLPLHAGAMKVLLKAPNGNLTEKCVVVIANSGTGKSTLTSCGLGLVSPEGTLLVQDDINCLTHDGRSLGTEQKGYYVMCPGLSALTHPVIWQAALSPDAIFENVMIKDGLPDFTDLSFSKNPRVLVQIKDLKATYVIDMPRVDAVLMVMRAFHIIPPIMRLTPARAGYEFMMGRTMLTAASTGGGAVNMVGFSEFIRGNKGERHAQAEEGNLFCRILQESSYTKTYLLNTGSVGGPKTPEHSGNIRLEDSSRLIVEALRGNIQWQKSLMGEGYEEPDYFALGMEYLRPLQYYDRGDLEAHIEDLQRQDRDWLKQFLPYLSEDIRALV